ncbi:hypothetical protein GIB67_005372 [Kingdonia uniflora]|uniref:RNase H type-1 domain-containing protein n=1 Tax=Kingdonia uniflora TaxID=39325 RepID=A0A7J7NHM6_9MAGN|nr:hypothetical protein GIB67_005372 [Kingdonia uniflora]
MQRQPQIKSCYWSLPKGDEFKAKHDGSCKGNSGQGGYGMVFRDDTGNNLKVFRSKTLVSQLLTRLNVNSILAAAEIAFSEIWWRLVIVTDSKAAAQAYSKEEIPWQMHTTGSNIFDKETVIENEVIKSSRWPCTRSFTNPVESFEDRSRSSSSVAENSMNLPNKYQWKKSSN